HCREEQDVDPDFLREIGFTGELPSKIYQGRGCKECGNTGYRGRLGIFELMLMDEDIRRLTITNADASQLRKTAIQNGMVTLRQDGFEKVKSGLTTISEVLRVTQDV